MRLAGRPRWMLASVGWLLWLGYPLVFLFGIGLRHDGRCGGQRFTGEFDDCFNDYLPLLESTWAAIALILTFGFIWFSYSLYSRPSDRSRWWWAAKSWRGRGWSARQALACIGVVWTVWNLTALPWREPFVGWAHVYWLLFFLWFVLSAWVNRPALVDGELA